MSDQIVKHEYGSNPEPLKVKLEKGQKGTYDWEISVSGDNIPEILMTLDNIDGALKQRYGGQ